MGELAERVSGVRKRSGAPSQLPVLLKSLPSDAAEDVRTLFDNPATNIAELRRQVMDRYPDAPVMSESTWFYWARMWKQGQRY